MAQGLIRTGVLQRWAYVTVFADCAPGEEEADGVHAARMRAVSLRDLLERAGGGAVAEEGDPGGSALPEQAVERVIGQLAGAETTEAPEAAAASL